MEPRQQFRNSRQHVIGVNIFEPGTGKPTAIALHPGETVWLSEDEQRMTAQAPRDPGLNHFVTGALEPVTDERPIGKNARPIAGIIGGAVQGPKSPSLQQDREAQDGEPVPGEIFEDTPEDRAARERAIAERQGRVGAIPEQHVEDRFPEVEQGSLAGDDAAAEPEEEEQAPAADETGLGGENADELSEEEQAADHREETGAAVDPAGDPPEGEYARNEEVGDPDAPAQTGIKSEADELAEAGTPFRGGARSADSGTADGHQENER